MNSKRIIYAVINPGCCYKTGAVDHTEVGYGPVTLEWFYIINTQSNTFNLNKTNIQKMIFKFA